jgi:hypothetical protein
MRRFRTKAAFDRQVREWDSTAKLLGYILADLQSELKRVEPEGWVRGGYSMTQHVSELKKTVTELTSNLETKLTQVPRIHELSETINARVDAIFSLATEERRGIRAMGHYMRIQQLKLSLAEKNPMFAPVADGLMADPFDRFRSWRRESPPFPTIRSVTRTNC